MRQRHSLDLGNCAGVADTNRETAYLLTVLQLHAYHMDCKPLPRSCEHLQAFASCVVGLHSGTHSVHKIMFFVQILREENTHAFVHVCFCSTQAALLQLVGHWVVVVKICFVIKEHTTDGHLVPVFKEGLSCQGIGLCARRPATCHNCGVLVLAEELQNVVCCWIIGLPSTVPSQNLLLQLLHAWLRCPQNVQLVLQLWALATHLLVELDRLDVW